MPVGITLKGQHEVMALNLLVTAAVGRVQGSRFLEIWWHVFHCCRANMGLAIKVAVRAVCLRSHGRVSHST